jgi:hypothetical protein
MFEIERGRTFRTILKIVVYRFGNDPHCQDEFESAKEYAGM